MLRRGAAPLRRRCALDEQRREEWDTGIGASSPKASDASFSDRAPRARGVRTPRHPVLALANLEVATGRVIAPSIGPSRTNEDFASHVAQTIATDPDAGWIFVVDQLNIHQSEALVKLVAKELGIELELDRKGNLKNIKAMASRRTFLSDRTHRIRFVYTPKHTSWLNQIELWFSILVRKLLKRGSFTSVEDLRQRILAFIEYFNRALAKPFKWTYKGRPLKV